MKKYETTLENIWYIIHNVAYTILFTEIFDR
jgi:hypothetical protein